MFGGLKNKLRRDEESPSSDAAENYPEDSPSRLMAFLLGLATLAITLIIALTLFWGARWLWQTITDDSSESEAPETTQPAIDEQPNSSRQKTKANGERGGAPSEQNRQTNNERTPNTGDQVPATGDQIPALGD